MCITPDTCTWAVRVAGGGDSAGVRVTTLYFELLSLIEHVSMYVKYVIELILRPCVHASGCSVSPTRPSLPHVSETALNVIRIPASPIPISDASGILPGIRGPVLGLSPEIVRDRPNCLNAAFERLAEGSCFWTQILRNATKKQEGSPACRQQASGLG